MKTLYILLFSLLVSGGLIAQSCLHKGRLFETRASIYGSDISTGSEILDSVGVWDQLGPLDNDVLGFAFGDKNADTIYTATRENGVYRSVDGGSSWDQINNGLSGDFIRSIDNNPNDLKTILAGTFNYGLYRSENSGESWNHIPGVISNTILDIEFNRVNGDTVYLSTIDDGVYRSWDAGDNWEHITPAYINATFRVFIDPNQSSHVYLMAWDTLYQSMDYGNTWESYYSSPDGAIILSMAIEHDNSEAMYVGSFNQLAKTLDGGLNWDILVDTSDFIITDIAIDFENNNILYMASPSSGVYKSENGGYSWNQLDHGGVYITMVLLGFHPQSTQVLYACSNGYGLLRTGELITSINETDIQNGEFMNIYPNPSSNQITIELPNRLQKNTILNIYNLNGQHLIKQAITEPQTVVDISGLPPGVYFIKIKDDKDVMVQKVIKQ